MRALLLLTFLTFAVVAAVILFVAWLATLPMGGDQLVFQVYRVNTLSGSQSYESFAIVRNVGKYLALALFALALIALRQRERAQRVDLVRIQARMLGARTLFQDTVAAAEQRRIRRELHDSLGHHLASATAHLDAARGQVSNPNLDRARDAMSRLVAESRQAIGGLQRPIRLREALQSLAGSIEGIQVKLCLDGLDTVSPRRAWAIFKAVQEAMTNAYKHAGARRVWVRAIHDSDGTTIRIENDGEVPTCPIVEGTGLSGMRERLALVGAVLNIDRGPPFALILSFKG